MSESLASRFTLPELPGPNDVPRLELTVEGGAGDRCATTLAATKDVLRIGAHLSNDLVLADSHVSEFHCKLRVVNGKWRVEDSGSRNGTRVDGVRVRDADLPLPSCALELGGSVVRVRAAGVLGIEVPVGDRFGMLTGRSQAMRRLFGLLERIAPTDSTVLISGESGSGKEVIATELVQRGPRESGPLVIVDGGAIAPALVESELFGHARGSFTGADRDRIGAFEAANGGTLFLDEVGELPLEIQPKLLRALEAREVRRVGETKARKIDVRVIAATNRALEVEVNQRRFREDLYFRLSVVNVQVPPLRERVEDIPLLVASFLVALGAENAERLFTPRVLEDMALHDWPGNVRELRNYVERAVVLKSAAPTSRSGTHRIAARAPDVDAPIGRVREDALAARNPDGGAPVDLDVPFRTAKEQVVMAFDRAYLSALLQWSGGNVSRAARRAGMDRIHLHRLLQRYGISLRNAAAVER